MKTSIHKSIPKGRIVEHVIKAIQAQAPRVQKLTAARNRINQRNIIKDIIQELSDDCCED